MGNCTGIYGNMTKVFGNLDACKLTEKERKKGIDIENLIGKEK